jgi:O-antigen ligase
VVAHSIIFVLVGKTGPLTLAAVLFCFAWWKVAAARRWLFLPLLAAALVVTMSLAPDLWLRFERGWRQLLQPSVLIDFESVGLRWQMWQFAFGLFVESPIWGHGTGAYHALAAQYLTHCEVTCFHPHSQFLFFAVEQGLIGVVAYGYLLLAIYRVARDCAARGSVAMMAFFAVLFIDSIFNVPLWYRMESYIFYPLVALFMATGVAMTHQKVPSPR